MANIPYSDYGIASINTDSFSQVEILAGDTPPAVTDYGIVGSTLAAAGIPAFTPVIVNASTRAVTLPVQGADVVDGVVWVPTNSPGCHIHADLGAVPGTAVQLTAGGAA